MKAFLGMSIVLSFASSAQAQSYLPDLECHFPTLPDWYIEGVAFESPAVRNVAYLSERTPGSANLSLSLATPAFSVRVEKLPSEAFSDVFIAIGMIMQGSWANGAYSVRLTCDNYGMKYEGELKVNTVSIPMTCAPRLTQDPELHAH